MSKLSVTTMTYSNGAFGVIVELHGKKMHYFRKGMN